MPATVTLSTTTLETGCSATENAIKPASTSGMTPGMRLFLDRELMSVISLGVDGWVNVLRGVDGTSASAHSSSATIYIGRADQFYSTDPVGRPPEAIPVSPYINTSTGDVWFAQGDAITGSDRWWQKQTTTYTVGALGVRQSTKNPTEST